MHVAVLLALLQHPAAPAAFPVTKVEITPPAAGRGYSRHGDRRADLVSFSSSNPRVASVTADGRLQALAPGRVTLTAKAGPATLQLPVQVVAGAITRLAVEPASSAVRTGDVIRFTVNAKDARGRAMGDVPVEWAVAASGAGSAAVAQIDAAGAFVAETPGVYTVTASLGGKSADAVVRVEQRRVTRGIDVLAHQIGRASCRERV